MTGPETKCEEPESLGVGAGATPLGVQRVGAVGGGGDWNKPCPQLLVSRGQVSVERRAEQLDAGVGNDRLGATDGKGEGRGGSTVRHIDRHRDVMDSRNGLQGYGKQKQNERVTSSRHRTHTSAVHTYTHYTLA